MLINHIHDALSQVRSLQQRVIESGRFKGYSGRARAISGLFALLSGLVMSGSYFPAKNIYHFTGWCIVLVFALVVNYGALVFWYRTLPEEEKDSRKLLPMFDSMAPLIVGGILSIGVLMNRDFNYLFPIWMCLFGLANMSARPVLPEDIWWVGIFYITAGALCIIYPGSEFINPLPMGLTFGIGEIAGGYIFFADLNPSPSIKKFLFGSLKNLSGEDND